MVNDVAHFIVDYLVSSVMISSYFGLGAAAK